MSSSDARRSEVANERALQGQVMHVPQDSEASPLREFLAVLWKGRYVALGIFAACVLCSVLYVMFKKPTYRATASLEIDPSRPSSLGLGDLVAGKLDGDESSRMQTEVLVLGSDTVALQAMSMMDRKYHDYIASEGTVASMKDAAKWSPTQREWLIGQVHSALKVASVPNSNFIQVTYTSRDPKFASDMVNSVVDAYVEHDFRSRYESASQVSDWLSKQMEGIRQRADEAQQKLADFQQQNNILGANETDNIITEKLRQVNDQLTLAEADRIVKEARYKVAETGNPELVAGIVPSATLQLLRTQQVQLQSDYAALAAKFGPSYPKLTEVKDQLTNVQQNIDTENQNVKHRIEEEFLTSKRTEEMLRSTFEQQKAKAFELNQNASQFSVLKHEVESSRDLYDTLQLKLKEAGVTAGLNSDVFVVDRAAVPSKPAAPRPVFSIFLGVLIGLIGGVGGAFAMESLDDTVTGTDETESLSRLPVLTAIPEFRFIKGLRRSNTNGNGNGNGHYGGRVESLISPRSLVSEGYRTLHNSIVFSSIDQPPQLLIFTSSLPGEGKSTTCLNYATVLAQQGSKVLLVDGDMRRPSLAKKLGQSYGEGLGSMLLHQASDDLVFHPIPEVPNLHFVPAGPVPTSPADALGSKRMKDILKSWCDNYDHVIIDTPPILSVSDALALARDADGVVMVVRAGKTPKKALLRSRDLLLRMQARIFGVVLNAVEIGGNGSYYNYSNSYGYGYSYGEEN